jgi:hypothetical protein
LLLEGEGQDQLEPLVASVANASATEPVVASANDPVVDEFIMSITDDIATPLLASPPRLRRSQDPDYSVVPRRSLRLADKTKASNPEVQATNVFLKKLGKDVPPPSSDASGARRFRETFCGNLSSSMKEAMRELFPVCMRFGLRCMAV